MAQKKHSAAFHPVNTETASLCRLAVFVMLTRRNGGDAPEFWRSCVDPLQIIIGTARAYSLIAAGNTRPKGSLPEGAVAVRRLRECTQAAQRTSRKATNNDPRPPAWLAARGDTPSVFAALRQLPRGGSLGCCRSLSAFLLPVPYCRKGAHRQKAPSPRELSPQGD